MDGEILDADHSMTNDDFKPSSSSTKSTRSSKPSSNGSRSRQHKRRRRPTNSEHSSSSSRSSSSSSSHSSVSSMKNSSSIDHDSKKTRSLLAQERLQTIIEKTKTGHYDVIDNFAFLTFETDDEWRVAFEHFHQQEQYQKSFTTKKSSLTSTRKNGHLDEHSDGLNAHLHRSISAPCKGEDGQRLSHSTPHSAPIDDTMTDNHRSSMWSTKTPHDLPATKTSKNESNTEKSHRTTSEHDDTQPTKHDQSPTPISSQKSIDESKCDTQEKKHHHHHHHHHHKAHKRHKTKHDLTINGDSSTKHPTITSMSDLAKQHIKHESMPMPPSFPFPSHFDPKLFHLPPYPPYHPSSSSHPPSYDPSLMLAGRLYAGQYPRDLPMPPPPPPSSRSHPHAPESSVSMEKMFEKFYPGVLPSYLAAAAASSPMSSLNMKLPGSSANGAEHSLWPHREAYQRQYLAGSTTKGNPGKSTLFESTNPSKLSSNHVSPSPLDRQHNSSNPPPSTPTGHPLYLAPVIVTEFHQHQHNHNHTHEHKLNITTKDDRSMSSSSSPRSKTPLSTDGKKPKSSFSVNDMFIDKPLPPPPPPPPPPMKHSPSPQQQGFLSVMNKKDTHHPHTNSVLPVKKSFTGKWSTAHVHIARMIDQHEQCQRDKFNSFHSNNKLRSAPALLPPPLPLLDNNNDLGVLRPPLPTPFGLPLDMNLGPYPLFRPPSSSPMKLSRPTTATPTSMKTPTIKREQKTPFSDERLRRPTPPPPPSPALSRSSSNSNFPPSSPSQRLRMDFPSLLLPPPQHQLPNFSLNDDRKRYMPSNVDLFPHPPPHSNSSPFLSSLFPMGGPPLSPFPPSSSRRHVHLGNSDSPKSSSLFPPPPTPPSLNPFDFTRTHLLPGGIPTFESDRYRLMYEHQARDRDIQFAMMAAAAAAANNGSTSASAPPPLFPDPNGSAMFKHY